LCTAKPGRKLLTRRYACHAYYCRHTGCSSPYIT
jgi:hypothetical protein